GGDLATSLLELGALSEGALLPLLSEALGMAPAEAGPLPKASGAALRLLPRAVALRYGIFPLEEREGELAVVVSEPLPRSIEVDRGVALGARLRQRVAPLVRIHEAIARDYGGPLEPRYSKLLSKLGPSPPVSGAAAARSSSPPAGPLVTDAPARARAPAI